MQSGTTRRRGEAWRVTHLVNCLGLGGTERQLVEQLRAVSGVEADLCVLQKTGEFMEHVRALDLEPQEFPLNGGLLQLNTVRQATRLAIHLRRSGSRLVHCHDYYSNLLGVAAARLAGLPCLVSRRDLGAWIGPDKARVLRIATRAASHVLCNAGAIHRVLLDEERLPASRVTVVPNGLDTARFDQAAGRLEQDWPLPVGAAPIFVMAGNMKHALKGHAVLLEAMAQLRRDLPNAHLLLAGDGALRPALEARAAELGLGGRVSFLGRRSDIPALLARSHIALSCSRTEGLPNAVMEAMAAHLPVIATAVGGTPELVRDTVTGRLVPPDDVEALAEAMRELGTRPALARRLGIAGRSRLVAEFSTPVMARRMEALYERLLGARREVRHAA